MTDLAKVILVTGGCSGLGAGVASSLASIGHRVVATCRNTEPAPSDTEGLRYITADMRDHQRLMQMVDEVAEQEGRLDAVYCNAGVQGFAPLQDLTVDHWNEVLAINVTAPFLLAKAAERHLAKTAGVLIFAASVHAERAAAGRLAYAASKSALVALSRNLAIELHSSNVRSVSLVLGPFHSPAMDEAAQRFFPNLTMADALTAYARSQPSSRIGDASEIAAAIEYLLSPKARYINGTSFHLDGGWSTILPLPPASRELS